MKNIKIFTGFNYDEKEEKAKGYEDYSHVAQTTSQDFVDLKDIIGGRVMVPATHLPDSCFSDNCDMDKIDLADIDVYSINKAKEELKNKNDKKTDKTVDVAVNGDKTLDKTLDGEKKLPASASEVSEGQREN